MTFPGYEILGELVRGEVYSLHRARREADGAPVLVKGPHPESSPPLSTDAIDVEFALRRELRAPGVLKAVELVRVNGVSGLVLDDPGVGPFADLGASGPWAVPDFLHLALQLAATLAAVHRQGLVHGNVQPASLLTHPATRELWLDGFSRAVRAADAAAGVHPVLSAAADLAYASPEQTGRTGRALERRSDLYSAGVVFYELLTGAKPFVSSDPLELAHAHIARSPRPVAEARPEVPLALSRLVGKLLEKNADARYQTAEGLRADLERCAREWNARRAIPHFALGARDVSDRRLAPQRLYGREKDVETLLLAFERARRGASILCLVAGYSGVGKTALIQELHAPIVERGGRFISGKLDLAVRGAPYGALLHAFRGLLHQILSEREESRDRFRDGVHRALGDNAAVVCELIPELELILGEQPPLPSLPPAEAQNRFRLVFQDFVAALSARDHPLVLFLDDLQWADAATLALLPSLLSDPDLGHFLLVGSYRENEVGPDHPLTAAVAGIEAAGAVVERLRVEPLGRPELERFLGDCLRRHDDDTRALVRLVSEKTAGNPFFVIQFLETLRRDGLLRFDDARGAWVFAVEDIARAPMTDNVIELMSRRIERLSEDAQRVLTRAACIGSSFDLATLAVVSAAPVDATEERLREALAEGLVVESDPRPTSARGRTRAFTFLHDRVQQAALEVLPEGERRGLRLRIGRRLLERWDPVKEEDAVFDVVGHLDAGRDLVTDLEERLAIARLNLTAGRRAKSKTAYRDAVEYLRTGIELLEDEAWRRQPELAFDLHREAAECEYLCGLFDEAERRLELLLEKAATPLDRARVHELRLVQYENRSRYTEAARTGLEGLLALGVVLPPDEAGKRAALEAELEAIARRLGPRPIRSIVELPLAEDPVQRETMRLLTASWAPHYVLGDPLLPGLISARLVRLSIEHGLTADTAYGCVTHAITVGPHRGDYAAAYEWGALALAVNERLDDRTLRAKVHQQFHAHVTLWRRPFETAVHHAREAWRSGLENGDFVYAGYGAFTESWPAFLTSRDLAAFVKDLEPNLAVLTRIRATHLASALGLILAWARALQGQGTGPGGLTSPEFDEEAFAREFSGNPFFVTLLHIARLHLALVLEDAPAARRAAAEARRLAWGRGTIWPVLLDVWGALAATSLDRAPDSETEDRAAIQAARDHLAALAASCPDNFRVFQLLLDAEASRIEGRRADAVDLFDEAIREARRTRSLQNEAMAHDLCARMWFARGNETATAAHVAEARRLYAAWGATAKVRQLSARYPWLRSAAPDGAGESLDFATVTKAAHALSIEIVLEELLRRLMHITIESAGAERGFFIREKDGRLVVEAEGAVGRPAEGILASRPLDACPGLAGAVVRYVKATGESLLLADAARDERFAADPYVQRQRPKSILCMPVVHQGALGGILYLENDLVTEAFTAERIRVLEVLSAQAAISLENARLFREKSEEVERRRLVEEDLRTALREVESLKNRLEAENVYLQEEIRREYNFGEMVGRSPALLRVMQIVERVAPADSTVLISGETGTGKELVARAIHDRSRRQDRPLVKVNCGAIPAGLVESELFGHVKGAFTGALEKRIGRFELAQGGTIFLDEIGELPLETQVKLLRVLQEHEFEPVGGSRTLRVDVRVIAATNRDLEAAVRSGQFRSDLFYRLNVLPITVPPLRERREDIPLLVALFLSRFSREFGKTMSAVARETMERLVRYPWSGNVRELQNVIERAVVLSRGPVLTLDADLNPLADGARGGGAEWTVAAPDPATGPSSSPLAEEGDLSLVAVERRHVVEVLQRTGGVVEGPAGAARLLGLHPNTLRSRMKKLGIRRTHEIS